MAVYRLVQGDLERPIGFTLGGTASLTEATSATWIMQQIDGSHRIQGPAVIDDPVKRRGHYQWVAGDTDFPGVYRAQIRVAYPGSLPETYPSDEDIFVIIRPRV